MEKYILSIDQEQQVHVHLFNKDGELKVFLNVNLNNIFHTQVG